MDEKRKVLIVAWDAADWEHITPLLDQGKLPVLESLINRGVMGNLATLQPVLSPMLWNSVATGKQPWKHGIHGFMEPDPDHGGQRVWSSQSRQTKALWNMLSQSGKRANVVNWWASHPAEPVNGCVVSNMISGIRVNRDGSWHVPSRTVHPPELANVIAPLAVFPNEMTDRQIGPFVPKIAEIDQDNDNRLSIVAKNLADMLTTHNISTLLMEKTEWDLMAVYFTAIDHFCHSFVTYHPPRLPWIKEEDFELYKEVINSTYRFSDMTLGRMLELAGPETTVIVCSDHGFQSSDLRLRVTPNEPAGPAYWHRKYGVFLAAGPGIRKDERVYGATLLDIAPTVLQLFGLPIGDDMDGRVLTEIFEDEPSIQKVSSWDDIESDQDGMLRESVAATPDEAEELVNQFVALGYVDGAGETKEEQEKIAATEAKYNLARNLAWCRKHREACALFEELFCQDPWESRFILHFAKALLSSKRYADVKRLMELAYDLETTRETTAICFWSQAAAELGEPEEAQKRLRKLEKGKHLRPGILLQIGTIYNQLKNLEGAERVFRRLLEIHPQNAEAHMVMSGLMLRKRENQAAADHALEAIGLVYNLSRAHLNLGIALIRGGDIERAEIAFKMAVKIRPDWPRAHRWLAVIYSGPKPDPKLAHFHRVQAVRPPPPKRTVGSNSEPELTSNWPEIPDEKHRTELLDENRPRRANVAVLSGKKFTLVSGLPRSGTSLMMQMLEIGGIEPRTDGQRVADKDNPKGYYEWEDIKKVGNRPQLMDEEGLTDKSIKVVSALLKALPYQHEYKVIFMNRPIDEVLTSQHKMIDRLGTSGAELEEADLRSELERHRNLAIAWLEGHPRAEVLVVDYPELLSDPASVVEKIRDFL